MKRLIITLVASLLAASTVFAEDVPPQVVDFRYTPPWWQSAICLPDDPEKALVGKEGQFFFDFGRGGPRNFAFSLAVGVEEDAKWLRQETHSAKVPIVRTFWDCDGVEVQTEALLTIPSEDDRGAPASLRRIGEQAFKNNWNRLALPCDAGFSNIALGADGKPIVYEAMVKAGSSVKVVFGLCEGRWTKPGQRPLKLSAEGVPSREVDLAKDFGRNVPGLYVLEARDADKDGTIRITVEPLSETPGRNAILNAIWVFPEDLPAKECIIRGEANATALAYIACGTKPLPTHRYVNLLRFRNTADKPQSRRPVVRIKSAVPVALWKDMGAIAIGGSTRVLASVPIESCEKQGNDWLVRCAPVELAAGEVKAVSFTVLRHTSASGKALSVARATKEYDRTTAWWGSIELPWDAVQVPDPGIQAMLQSCVRNIWQVREIVDGRPAFHVGPTWYRDLWIVDGAFLLETAAMLGRAKEARAGIEYMLRFQKPDGSFEVIPKAWKENGIVLWACCRHAALTQDKAWLESVWPRLEKTVQAIRHLRARSRKEGTALDDGLFPPGFPDGGLDGHHSEYVNVYWNLTGLKAVVDAAQWLGKKDQASEWQKEYDDLFEVFHKAAKRDLTTDKHGNRYLPTIMGEAGKKELPQRAQWAFLNAVHPGQVFARDDPLVQGNLAMLRANRKQGLLLGTGWDAEGIWTYAASFYGHALLWRGQGAEAAQVLYDYANHAAPVRVWREEQSPVGKGTKEVGDMPHNWASAEFIRLAVHLIQLDRGDELHLFEGLPRSWTGPGKTTRLNGVATPFGPLSLFLTISDDGKTAQLNVRPLNTKRCKRIVVHLGRWSGRAKEEIVNLKVDKEIERTFELR